MAGGAPVHTNEIKRDVLGGAGRMHGWRPSCSVAGWRGGEVDAWGGESEIAVTGSRDEPHTYLSLAYESRDLWKGPLSRSRAFCSTYCPCCPSGESWCASVCPWVLCCPVASDGWSDGCVLSMACCEAALGVPARGRVRFSHLEGSSPWFSQTRAARNDAA